MSNNLKKQKKQALLGKVQGKHKARIKKTPDKGNPTVEKAALTADNQPTADKKSNGKWLALAIFALLILIFPKPKLITYEKLGLVSQSVYWDGLPGINPVLFDSHLHPRPALERNTLYLCANLNDPNTCQRYKILEQSGVFFALKKLIID
ncbi:hypothetical protein PSECIP111854_03532 [Pseudoalteromonas sp. CIP111854]|uniref:Uncharacterized protein n=1 Tax=Pseudoalteromonas holothuriae TaxID=2963714 RepID=A0A9W4VUN0_9GAMM|nr:hypothetical protein [Pseudoalteromonas sp. CIP111854]CAH9064766.1 hypothetical protein PSECIP111854_03532 [Pseudoalteromonas sp. CIP111854]